MTSARRAQGTAGEAGRRLDAGATLFADKADAQWLLPRRLREVSGLATTADGRLFGHDDEKGIVHELDIERGDVRKRFAVGEPVERRDFEGLAITPEDDFYLVTSAGRLLRFREGGHRASVAFEAFDTGLREVGEIEGLAFLPGERSLILACKKHYARAMRDVLALYAWSTETRSTRTWLALQLDRVAEAAGSRVFAPSAVEIDPRTGRIILVSARGRSLVEIDRDGSILAARRLSACHAQAEGATILPDGALVIADEGGDGCALLSRYPRRAS